MTLGELFSGNAVVNAQHADVAVTGIALDSRLVKPGDVFFALGGSKTDGAGFIEAAIEAGAVAVVADRSYGVPVPLMVVSNPRRTLAKALAVFYTRQPRTIAAVTGTSGKTSVVAFTRQLWDSLGYDAASLGTIGIVSRHRNTYGSLTTPDPVALHRALSELASDGVTHLALEASSHGLDQHRLDGVRIAAAAFTNLSRDHMDYHPTVEHYLAAKLRLFTELSRKGAPAVIAADHEHSSAVIAAARTHKLDVITVGRRGEAIRLVDAEIDGFGQIMTIGHGGQTRRLRLPLVGEFQIENALVAAGLVIATGGDAGRTFAALEHLEGAKGRLELVGARNGAPVFVDYAHKPDALMKALEALRPYAKGRLVVVFGAGGDRDAGKRPLMGAIAAQYADAVIVTDDNPRSENPVAIRAEILAAASGAAEIGDRGEAIRSAVASLRPGDVLLIAGKGHETGQIIGDKVLPFSDHEAARAALAEHAA